MYDKYNPYSYIVERSNQFVIDNDRKFYDQFFSAVESFMRANQMILGGLNGINLLIGNFEVTRDSYQYSIYSSDPFRLGKEICDILSKLHAPHIDLGTIFLETNVSHKEFTIYIMTRPLFKIYALGIYRGVKLQKLIGNVFSQRGLFTEGSMMVMPNEVYLIGIYQKLYQPYVDKPGGYQKWTDLQNIDRKIWPVAIRRLKEKDIEQTQARVTKEGGDEQIIDENDEIIDEDYIYGGKWDAHDKLQHGKMSKTSLIASMHEKILRDYICNSDMIVVGDYAIGKFGKNRLQILTQLPIETILEVIKKLTGDENFSVQSFNMELMDDQQLVKNTIYYKGNLGSANPRDRSQGAAEPFMDVYNSTSYEVVPTSIETVSKISNVRIGNKYVLLRFKLIDLWALNLISAIGSSDPNFIKQKRINIIEDCISLHGQIEEMMSDGSIKDLYDLGSYVGIYIDPNIFRKKQIKESIKHKKYFPSIMSSITSP